MLELVTSGGWLSWSRIFSWNSRLPFLSLAINDVNMICYSAELFIPRAISAQLSAFPLQPYKDRHLTRSCYLIGDVHYQNNFFSVNRIFEIPPPRRAGFGLEIVQLHPTPLATGKYQFYWDFRSRWWEMKKSLGRQWWQLQKDRVTTLPTGMN